MFTLSLDDLERIFHRICFLSGSERLRFGDLKYNLVDLDRSESLSIIKWFISCCSFEVFGEEIPF